MTEEAATAASSSYIPFPDTGAYPVRAGNRVRPLVDGGPTLARIAEAVEAARHSVWVTVAFLAREFRMPGGCGSLFDLLDRAVERGLDVRVLFWRNNPESAHYGNTFAGSEADRAMLGRRNARFNIRWDRVEGPYVHHQKSWLLDAGTETEVAFLGGLNLTGHEFAVPGHRGGGFHDIFVEVTGPAGTDIHHNFVQRWNEASERHRDDGLWGPRSGETLPFPARVSARRGDCRVQIQRNIPAGRYTDGHATPGGLPQAIADGERAIHDQYLMAIDAAQRTIYLEHQGLAIEPILARLDAALTRGVEVVYLAPGVPEQHIRIARRQPERRPQFERLAALARHPHFLFAALANGEAEIYVHAKAMLVDDAWATIGSCNLHAFSLFGHTELNASFWAPEVVRALRVELLAEHLAEDTRALGDVAALALFREIARENRGKPAHARRGLAYALDPPRYGE